MIKTRNFSFPLIDNSVTIGLNFSITKDISNDILRYDQYFQFINRIVFFNIFINTVNIISVFSKSFRFI